MSWWAERVVPRLVDRSLGTEEVGRLRAMACAGLRGRVIEVGFGSGLNLAHYPGEVSEIGAVEPSDLAWTKAAPRIAAARCVVRRADRDAQHLALPDDSFDAALTTFTLCTIPDPVAALHEIRRVLRPGARLHLAEHGLAPDPEVVRWQRRLAPFQHAVFGGCRLDRDIAALLEAGGFRWGACSRFYAPGPRSSRPFGALYLGWATAG